MLPAELSSSYSRSTVHARSFVIPPGSRQDNRQIVVSIVFSALSATYSDLELKATATSYNAALGQERYIFPSPRH